MERKKTIEQGTRVERGKETLGEWEIPLERRRGRKRLEEGVSLPFPVGESPYTVVELVKGYCYYTSNVCDCVLELSNPTQAIHAKHVMYSSVQNYFPREILSLAPSCTIHWNSSNICSSSLERTITITEFFGKLKIQIRGKIYCLMEVAKMNTIWK